MSRLSRIGSELLGLFVDDRGFAGAILLWLGFVFLCLRWRGISAQIMAGLLFAGLAAILIGSAWRADR